LFLNFGDEARVQDFLAKRLAQGLPDAIKTFQVPASYVESLRSSAVPESEAAQFPNSPIAVDINQAADQYGLRPANFAELQGNIISGSGYEP
jgi:hypothetical protein